MAAGLRHDRTRFTVVALALLIASVVAATPGVLDAADAPRRGGVLLAVIGADPPSLDPHQESTFANIQLVAPLYSTLLQLDPYNYPKVVGDAAAEWKISSDGLTYTFKLRPGIRFHDGSPLTAADVKATYDKIVFPPQGVLSIRKAAYSAVERLEAPEAGTVVFKLKFPSASLLDNLASPWNVIYPKKYLDQDPNYFKTNVVGSGPFKFKSYTRGATFEGVRNPDYFVKDRPYLDGYKFFISPETSVRAAAIRSGRAYVEFRDLPSAEVEAIKKQLGDKIAVQETPMTGQWGIAINNTVKPFSDVRVRKALSLGFDRYTASRVLFPLTGLKGVGGLMRPGTEFAIPEPELVKLPGFSRDIEKSRAEAKRLLTEAGFPNGLKVVLKNRNVKLPYQDFAVFVIQEWRKIGVEAENRPPRDRGVVRGHAEHGELRAERLPHRRVRGRPRPVPGPLRHRQHPELGALLRPPDRRPVPPAGAHAGPRRAQEAHRRDQQARPRKRVLHAGTLVDAQRGALGEGEKLRGAAQPLHQPEAPGRLAGRGLRAPA